MHLKEELIVRIVNLVGDYYQIGLNQGKELNSLPILEQLGQLRELTKNCNVQRAKKLIKDFSPNLFEELKGVSRGAF